MDTYEKKYNEALSQARFYYWNCPTEPEKKKLESIFPELQSEDERIRKWIAHYIHAGVFSEDEHPMALKAIEWLEKQKDEKQNATEKLSKVLKDFAEGYRRVLKKKGIDYIFSDEFFKGSAVCYSRQEDVEFQKWYKDLMLSEEKQKENPKSADSIPADCVSSAKCEDRWHKVTDSLPDNPREVLCKDEAGNYFIGRYYVGEGWEISNYDDEDKPHHLNPPVSKWIDFPSEKQKEPTTEELYAEAGTTEKEYIANTMKTVRAMREKQKEQKPAEWTLPKDFEEAVYKVANFISPFDSQEELRKVSHRFAEQLLDIAKKDVQKPVECVTDAEMKKGLDELTKFKHFASALSDMYNIIPSHSSLRPKDIDWNNFCAGLLTYLKKNQPVELSEEDFDAMFDEYCDQHPNGLTLEECGRFFYEKGKKACQEWSDEDEKNCNRIIRFLEPHKTFFPTKETKEEMQNWIKNRFKSLRPSWKPSEEQMEALLWCVAHLGGADRRVLAELYEHLKMYCK